MTKMLQQISLSWGDILKFAAGLIMVGVMYGKVDNLEKTIVSSTQESKEYRTRIEKLEISVVEINVKLENYQFMNAQRPGNYVQMTASSPVTKIRYIRLPATPKEHHAFLNFHLAKR